MQTNSTIAINRSQVVSIAEKMRRRNHMLVMIHGHLEPDGTPVVSYEYDEGTNVLSYEVRGEKSLPSIASIYDAAAAWPEREINELIGVEFEGLDTSERLFLPENMLDGKGQITVTPIDQLRKLNGLD